MSMKKIFFLVFAAAMFIGCAKVDRSYRNRIPESYNVIVIDSCEYVHSKYTYGIAHKGNCRYCEERRRKRLE